MAISFNGATKVISLSTGTVELSIRDLWSRWVDWLLTSDNSKYEFAFSQVGGDTISETAGTAIPVYIFLLNNWKIKPQEASHTLTVNDGIIVSSGDPFLDTLGNYNVRINYSQPVQAITVATGGGSGITLGQIESSSILAKEATINSSTQSIKNHVTVISQI